MSLTLSRGCPFLRRIVARFGDELRVSADSVVGDVAGHHLLDKLVLLDDGEQAVVQNQLASARGAAEVRRAIMSNAVRFGAGDAALAVDARGPALEQQRHASKRVHVMLAPGPETESGGAGSAHEGKEAAAGSGGAASEGGTVVRGSTGPLIQEWKGEAFDKNKDVLKPFSVKDTTTKSIAVNTDPFFNQSLAVRRVAWLFGTVGEDHAITVQAWYEPPQYGFVNRFLLLEDAHRGAVDAIAAELGYELVGWCFTCPFRAPEEPLTGPEVMKIAQLQARIPHFTTLVFQSERLPAELVQQLGDAAGAGVAAAGAGAGAGESKVSGTTHAGRTVTVQSMQAYQLQKQIVELARQGKLHYDADRPERTNGSAHILWSDETKMGVNPDTDDYGPTNKIMVSYAAAPVPIIGLNPFQTDLRPPWFPAGNRYDQHGSQIAITPALYQDRALQEFLAAHGNIDVLQVFADFNFLVHAARLSIAAYGAAAWESTVTAFRKVYAEGASPPTGEALAHDVEDVLGQRYSFRKDAGVPEAWFTPEEVLSMARHVRRFLRAEAAGDVDSADRTLSEAESFAPKVWRLMNLGWRCPHCHMNGQLNKFDAPAMLVAHLRRVHQADDEVQPVLNPLSAAFANCAVDRNKLTLNLERDLRQHHLARRLGITASSTSDDEGEFDSIHGFRQALPRIARGGFMRGPSRAERERQQMRQAMEASMREAGMDEAGIAAALAEDTLSPTGSPGTWEPPVAASSQGAGGGTGTGDSPVAEERTGAGGGGPGAEGGMLGGLLAGSGALMSSASRTGEDLLSTFHSMMASTGQQFLSQQPTPPTQSRAHTRGKFTRSRHKPKRTGTDRASLAYNKHVSRRRQARGEGSEQPQVPSLRVHGRGSTASAAQATASPTPVADQSGPSHSPVATSQPPSGLPTRPDGLTDDEWHEALIAAGHFSPPAAAVAGATGGGAPSTDDEEDDYVLVGRTASKK